MSLHRQWLVGLGIGLLAVLMYALPTQAITPLPIPDPQPGSYGLEATKRQPAPVQGATITVPGSGASFSSSPITVSGICPTGLLVQIYNNNVMVGSVMCENGSFRLEVSLFAGANELVARVYDDLDQAGPDSASVTVNYTDTSFTAFGTGMTLTSTYGRISRPAGNGLEWPLQLFGGTGPYAFSIDWGDGGKLELKSQSLAGLVSIAHTYKRAGIYRVSVTATDTNGVSAFLQLTAVSSGKPDAEKEEAPAATQSKIIVIWIPAVIAFLLLVPAYWLGRRSQLVSLRNRLEKERDSYKET